MADDREIIALDDIKHVLLRPNTYIGSVTPTEREEWVFDGSSIKRTKLIYPEGLLKIINEIIDNSVDEGIKTNWKYSSKISVTIGDKIVVEDNGRGLPVKQNKDGVWQPVLAFTELRAGSNFGNNRESIGTNGIGSSATNIFSKYFEVVTSDGEKKLKLVCKDNLSSKKFTVSDSDKFGTKVSFIPDYNRFGLEKLPEEIITMIKTRLKMLSWFFPECSFYFNKEKMNVKVKEFANLFPQPNVLLSNDNIFILTYPSEEPEYLTYVNGISLRRGGTHVDFILNNLVNDIREKVSRKYKTIKPNDIKNRLGLVVLIKGFPNCSFDSQTKEYLSNPEREIKSFLEIINLQTFNNKVLKEKGIIDNITELFQLKEELKEKKELKKLNSKRKTIDSSKYFTPIGDKNYLCITEGQSAFGGIAPVLGRRGIGYYQIQGKILNVQDTSLKKALENEEIGDLVNILGIDISDEKTTIDFDKIVITSDADSDGSHIAALLITLFNRICPEEVKKGKLCRLNTPLLIGMKGDKIVKYYFTLPDQNSLDPKLKWKYQKGLGGWGGKNSVLLQQIIEQEGGLDNLLMPLIPDDKAVESINNWMGNDSSYRKSSLRGKEFHIDAV